MTPDIEVLFVAGFGPIVKDVDAGVALYRDTLGLPLAADVGPPDYFHGTVAGVKHFALWPLHLAAAACFGTDAWPPDVPVPTAWVEFDVADLAKATETLAARGYRLLVSNREEPWGQTVTRFLSPDGLLVGATVTPFLREGSGDAG